MPAYRDLKASSLRTDQRRLTQTLRRLGFFISEFPGLDEAGLLRLFEDGVIQVEGVDASYPDLIYTLDFKKMIRSRIVGIAWVAGGVLVGNSTGFCVRYKGRHWIATCGHDLAKWYDGLNARQILPILMADGGLNSFPRYLRASDFLSSSSDDDANNHPDLGCLLLLTGEALKEHGKVFVDLDNQRPLDKLPRGGLYLVSGFPNQRLREVGKSPSGQAIYNLEHLSVVGRIARSAGQLFDRVGNTHFKLEFPFPLSTAEPMEGMSGSPVWRVDAPEGGGWDESRLSLVGIFDTVELRTNPDEGPVLLRCDRIGAWKSFVDERMFAGTFHPNNGRYLTTHAVLDGYK